MRAKRPYIVLSFRATVDAMAWEKHCLAEHIPGRAHSAAAGAFRRVRSGVADAAGGLAVLAGAL